MYYIREKRSLNVNSQLALETILGIDQYHLFLPWCTDSKIISHSKNTLLADLTIKFKGIKKIFRSEVKYDIMENQSLIISKSDSEIFSSLETKWEITQKQQITEIYCLIKVEFNSKLFNLMFNLLKNLIKGNLVDSFMKRILYLKKLKKETKNIAQ